MDLHNKSLYDFNKTHYEYSFVLPMERDFDVVSHLLWFRSHFHVAIVSVLIYMVIIFSLKQYMKNRPRIELRRAAIVWNFSLAAFSWIVVLRYLPDIAYDIWVHGFSYTLCDASFVFTNPVGGLWGILFLHSKIVELGDTVFLVLRKRQLTVLHLYHHISVPLMSWYLITKQLGPARWVALVNGGVHSFMYTYFGLKVVGFRLPLWVSVCMTMLQISQMVFGGYCISVILQIKSPGGQCAADMEDLLPSFLLVISYTVLFLNFFYHAYIKNNLWMERPRLCYDKCREFVGNFSYNCGSYLAEDEQSNDKKLQ